MTDAPQDPPTPAPPAPVAPPEPPPSRPLLVPILIGAAVAGLLVFGYFAMQGQVGGGLAEDAYNVQPYTPPSELVAVRDHVPAHEGPDLATPIVVTYGPGVTLNVTGRVSRGLGNDWYAVSWNNRIVFVRQQDAVAGAGAPPPLPEREVVPEEEKEDPEIIEEPDEEEEEVAEAEASPSYGLEMSDVEWIREPNARDFARFYPTDALDEGQSGRVTLDCVIAGSGRLDCSVMQESPSGHGFGDAAVSISRQVRVQPTLPDGSSAAGRHLRLPLAFRAG